jgi:NTE family protein
MTTLAPGGCTFGTDRRKIDVLPARKRPTIALVLSGGGARGAYEAGIIKWIRHVVPRELGHHANFRILTGTSVGAINACFLAATAEDLDNQGQRMADAWGSLCIEDVISLRTKDLYRGLKILLGRTPPKPEPGQFRYGGLLQTRGLERFVFRMVPWRQIHRNVHAGLLDAIALSATRVGTGHTVVFMDIGDEPPPPWSRNPFIRSVVTRIGPRHALASAAIPLLFPAVKIAGHFYTDGGLRQNTPMSPAIRLGADRLLVISLKHISDAGLAQRREQEQREREAEAAYPRPLYIAGKALNALLLDHTEYDMDRMDRMNAILKAGRLAFGAEFEEILARELKKLRGAPLREVQAQLIRPSVDIGEISSSFIRNRRYRVTGRLARRLFDRIADGEAAHESDLISYLLFDGLYAAELVELGYKDAEARREDLLGLFRETGD